MTLCHSCHSHDAAAAEVAHSWRSSLAGLGAKAITMQSDLGGNPNWFYMNSHLMQIKAAPGQVGGWRLAGACRSRRAVGIGSTLLF